MRHRKQLILATFALVKLIVFLIIIEATGLDIWLQNKFYDVDAKTWLVDRHNTVLDWVFYTGPKSIIIAIGGVLTLTALTGLISEKLTPYRVALWWTVLAMAVIPAGASLAKATTHIHCPRELTIYGGKAIYNPMTDKMVGQFKTQPAGVKQGRCFPAGHASGGFALMAFALLLPPSRRKWAYIAGIGTGCWMATYQMLNGAHFLSHTIVTTLWAVFVTQLVLYVAALGHRSTDERFE